MQEKSTQISPSASVPEQKHQSVLAKEALAALQPQPGGVYVDATMGDGGHSRAILQRIGPKGRLFALDRDPEAIQRSVELTHDYPEQLIVVHTPFSKIKQVLVQHNVVSIQGVLFDLGVSSRQLDKPGRGFSFQHDGPLDMRMDHSATSCSSPEKWMNAATIVNTFTEERLVDIFFRFGEERHARRAARAIVQDRQRQPFTTTRQLASLLERILPRQNKNSKITASIHPATRIFQALRIAVNRELEELQSGLSGAMEQLANGGKIAVISFHSLEDRIVKQIFRQAVNPLPPPIGPASLLQPSTPVPRFRLLTRKPLFSSTEEIQNNPRARSARMRVIERLTASEMSE